MSANVEKFAPPDCTRFGGVRPDGQVRCWNEERTAYMDVPPNFCHCAYQYENRRTETDKA